MSPLLLRARVPVVSPISREMRETTELGSRVARGGRSHLRRVRGCLEVPSWWRNTREIHSWGSASPDTIQ